MRGGICPVFRRLNIRDWNDPAETRQVRKALGPVAEETGRSCSG
jgi:hypothetical protein